MKDKEFETVHCNRNGERIDILSEENKKRIEKTVAEIIRKNIGG